MYVFTKLVSYYKLCLHCNLSITFHTLKCVILQVGVRVQKEEGGLVHIKVNLKHVPDLTFHVVLCSVDLCLETMTSRF